MAIYRGRESELRVTTDGVYGTKVGTLQINTTEKKCAYIKGANAAIVEFGFAASNTSGTNIIQLPEELQGYSTDAVVHGNLTVLSGGSITVGRITTIISGTGAGVNLSIIGANAMPLNIQTGQFVQGSISLFYD